MSFVCSSDVLITKLVPDIADLNLSETDGKFDVEDADDSADGVNKRTTPGACLSVFFKVLQIGNEKCFPCYHDFGDKQISRRKIDFFTHALL